jgi:hypothetical protein
VETILKFKTFEGFKNVACRTGELLTRSKTVEAFLFQSILRASCDVCGVSWSRAVVLCVRSAFRATCYCVYSEDSGWLKRPISFGSKLELVEENINVFQVENMIRNF